MNIDVRILCPVRIERDGEPVHVGAQARGVLAVLALRQGSVVSQGELIEALWPGTPPRSARVQVQGLVSALRRALGSGTGPIATEPAGYVLQLSASELDLIRFRELIGYADQLRDEGSGHEAMRRYEGALDLWSDNPCGDVDLPLVRDLVEPLGQLYADALEEWAATALATGLAAKVATRLRPAVARHPYRERMRGLLMTALSQAGRCAEALVVYEHGRRHLAEQLGVDPSRRLQGLYRDLLSGAALAPASAG